MKTLLFVILFCPLFLSFSRAKAQCTETPANCNYDLRNPIFNDNQILIDKGANDAGIPYKKNATTTYQDVVYDADCGAQDDCDTDPDNSLIYWVFYPDPSVHNYNENTGGCKLPALIMFHGGKYSDCVHYDVDDFTYLCQEFAKRGFVVFDVEYRRGVLIDRRDQDKYTSAQQMLAFYRGSQDVRGAIRSIIRTQILHSVTNTPYEIDINNVFLGGNSAGSVVAMSAAYYQTQSMINAVVPTPIGNPTIQDVLGDINIDYYFGNPTYDYIPKLKGILNMWGAMYIPLSYENNPPNFFVQNQIRNPVPIISFHGAQDDVFNVIKEDVYFSPLPNINETDYHTESSCLLNNLTFKVDGDNDPQRDMLEYGAYSIYTWLKQGNILTECYVDCDMKHGLDDDCNGQIGCVFDSEFGTGASNSTDVGLYMVQRASIFFQQILETSSNDQLGKTLFIECANYRHNCNTQDDHATGCPNNCSSPDFGE